MPPTAPQERRARQLYSPSPPFRLVAVLDAESIKYASEMGKMAGELCCVAADREMEGICIINRKAAKCKFMLPAGALIQPHHHHKHTAVTYRLMCRALRPPWLSGISAAPNTAL